MDYRFLLDRSISGAKLRQIFIPVDDENWVGLLTVDTKYKVIRHLMLGTATSWWVPRPVPVIL